MANAIGRRCVIVWLKPCCNFLEVTQQRKDCVSLLVKVRILISEHLVSQVHYSVILIIDLSTNILAKKKKTFKHC